MCPDPHMLCSVSEMLFFSSLDVEVQRMKKAVESLMVANEEKVSGPGYASTLIFTFLFSARR